MDLDILQAHLVRAESHVVTGESQLARQRVAIEALRHAGLDTALQKEILDVLEHAQELYVADRDHLRRWLAERIAASASG